MTKPHHQSHGAMEWKGHLNKGHDYLHDQPPCALSTEGIYRTHLSRLHKVEGIVIRMMTRPAHTHDTL